MVVEQQMPSRLSMIELFCIAFVVVVGGGGDDYDVVVVVNISECFLGVN